MRLHPRPCAGTLLLLALRGCTVGDMCSRWRALTSPGKTSLPDRARLRHPAGLQLGPTSHGALTLDAQVHPLDDGGLQLDDISALSARRREARGRPPAAARRPGA